MALKLTKYIVTEKRINQEEKDPVICHESYIPADAWKGDVELEEMDLGEYITRVSAGAFQDCTSLTTVTFHNSLKHIDANAFVGCTSLQKIVLPENLDEVICRLDDGRGAKTVLSTRPTSETLIENLKQGYPIDFYYKGEYRNDHWD